MIVGLTGGIGSGKTTVAKLFADLGVPVYNSDIEAKKLMQKSIAIRKKITQLFGEESYHQENLNTQFIAQKVFGDKEALKKLNGIVHPAVRRHFSNWAKRQKYNYVIQESALIFESGIQEKYDKIILVVAPVEIRINRLQERDNTTRKQLLQRIENQLPDAEKKGLADFIIENIEIEKTKLKVSKIHTQLLAFTKAPK